MKELVILVILTSQVEYKVFENQDSLLFHTGIKSGYSVIFWINSFINWYSFHSLQHNVKGTSSISTFIFGLVSIMSEV